MQYNFPVQTKIHTRRLAGLLQSLPSLESVERRGMSRAPLDAVRLLLSPWLLFDDVRFSF